MREHVCWMVERKLLKPQSPDSEFCKVWLTMVWVPETLVMLDSSIKIAVIIVVRQMVKPLCNMKRHESMRWCLPTWVQKNCSTAFPKGPEKRWRQHVTFFLESRLLLNSRTCQGNCLVHSSRFLLWHPFLCIFSRIIWCFKFW